jgi:hypothetical protein
MQQCEARIHIVPPLKAPPFWVGPSPVCPKRNTSAQKPSPNRDYLGKTRRFAGSAFRRFSFTSKVSLFSFSPGFSPVQGERGDSATVLTVYLAKPRKPLKRFLGNPHYFCTGLKPGENEKGAVKVKHGGIAVRLCTYRRGLKGPFCTGRLNLVNRGRKQGRSV